MLVLFGEKMQSKSSGIVLLVHCLDQQGIIAHIAEVIAKYTGNILHLEQHTDPISKTFFLRLHWQSEHTDIQFWQSKLAHVIHKFEMQATFHDYAQRKNVAVFVSKADHCLYDLLARHHSGELFANISLIASNHQTLSSIAKRFDVPFVYAPINKNDKAKQEALLIEACKDATIDLVVLARYMQILSSNFIHHYPNKIINIHHSFLPAFAGAKPYHQAWERGVKMIGATSHFVTETLDDGPIIAQSAVKVSHQDNVDSLIRIGRVLEKNTLAEALHLFLNHKVLVYGQRTIVFK